jgi:DNA-binding GntR family transcriptional regulator
MARPHTSPSRADDLAHELQVEILTGRIPLGTRLRQEDLAARFGVSRTPIREALRQLQAIGLVEQLGHRGALVKSFEPDECRNIFLVRAELEGLAAERAAGRLTNYDNADLAAAQALLRAGAERHKSLPESAQEERRITLEQCSQANELYHNVVLAAANCPPLRDTVQSLANQVPRTLAWHTFADDPGIVPRSAGDHDRITEALNAPDKRRARRLLQEHVMDTGETLARWLERQAPR